MNEEIAGALKALATYQEGSSRASLIPLDELAGRAVRDAALRESFEQALAAALDGHMSAVAKEYICSKLRLIGSAAAVPALGRLLTDAPLADAARRALEVIPGPEANVALREGLARASGAVRAGIIQSLGARRDTGSVPRLTDLAGHADTTVAAAAAAALGQIGTAETARILLGMVRQGNGVAARVWDACLCCAERLLAANDRSEAAAIYQLLSQSSPPKHVKVAAARGLLMAAKRP